MNLRQLVLQNLPAKPGSQMLIWNPEDASGNLHKSLREGRTL